MRQKNLSDKIKKAGEEIRTYGVSAYGKKVFYHISNRINADKSADYAQWLKWHKLTAAQMAKQRNVWSKRDKSAAPCFLVVVNTEGESSERIERTKQSLKEQTYLPDKVFLGTNGKMAERILEYWKKKEGRERTWILKLPAGDVLTPDFFYHCVQAIQKEELIRVWYTDHESWTDEQGKPEERKTFFKPDFSEDYLGAYSYIGDAFLAHSELFGENLDLLRQDSYCLLLEWAAEGMRFGHISKMLYTQKQYDGGILSVSGEQQKWLEGEREKRLLQIYQQDTNHMPEQVWAEPGKDGTRQIRLLWKEKPLISVMIPNKDHAEDLFVCLKSLQKQTIADQLEVLILENNSEEVQTFAFYQWLLTGQENVHLSPSLMDETLRESFLGHIRVLYWEGGFHYSAINNFGAKHASGEYLLLLNNDVELIHEDGLQRMLEVGMLERVGVVGAKLYYEDETVQHAGVVVGLGGVAGHAFVGLAMDDSGYMKQADCLRRVSAVTAACLLVKASLYQEVGGLNEELAVAFNDVDFCLKVKATGKQLLYQPACEAWHYESKSRGSDTQGEKLLRFQQELFSFQDKWDEALRQGDAYYNENLTLDHNDYSYRRPYSGYGE